MKITLTIPIECGEKTCASEPGKFCQFLDMGRWGCNPACSIWGVGLTELTEQTGWLQRCPQCLRYCKDGMNNDPI
jgi:hypothetical protein